MASRSPFVVLHDYTKDYGVIRPIDAKITISWIMIKAITLTEIEKILQRNDKSLKDHSCLPYQIFDDVEQFQNKFIVDELNYNKQEMTAKQASYLTMMTAEHNGVYDNIMQSVLSESGRFFFLYGYGRTSKTFV
ncbi:uncharacterized protein LOC130743628 [Lotus japonicus]|uniref:uncharacterized protein LOC130743628 n=1 Tax=Lotus japonicus TaxID=34305 RepID=UPI00258F2973|nr:uncharacterized protein LOC130743628 [Lotus japonicus]